MFSPFLGVAAYKLTILMHDCAHNTLFTSYLLNQKVGKLAGYILASNYWTFAKQHWLHHKEFGTSTDPQGDNCLGFSNTSRIKIIGHLLKPLVGGNVFKLLQFSRKRKNDSFSNAKRTETCSFVLLVTIVQLVVATIITGIWTWPFLSLLLPVSTMTFGLFFSQMRGFCEPLAESGEKEEGRVRIHLPNWFDKLFFVQRTLIIIWSII
ncbi:MAG: fatty acid desaturase [Pseudomonadota bacterium]